MGTKRDSGTSSSVTRPASLPTFQSAADAAAETVDQISRAADEATGWLDGTGARRRTETQVGCGREARRGFGEKLDTIGEDASAPSKGCRRSSKGSTSRSPPPTRGSSIHR